MTTIKLQHIHKRYSKRTDIAVNDFSYLFQKKTLTAIVGPSGCGKSTLLKIIAGLDLHYSGSVCYNDTAMEHRPAHTRDCVLMMQRPLLFPHLTVYENVAFGLKIRKQPTEQITATVNKMLTDVGMVGYDDRLPHTLSGGEQQRVSLARAMAVKPQILLLDEPLTNLDRELWRDITQLMLLFHQQYNLTTILVTHNQEEASLLADDFVLMVNGTIMQSGTPEQLFNTPQTVQAARFFDAQNIVRGIKKHNTFRSGNSVLQLAGAFSTVRDGELFLVIRPEHIVHSNDTENENDRRNNSHFQHSPPESDTNQPHETDTNTPLESDTNGEIELIGKVVRSYFTGVRWSCSAEVAGNLWYFYSSYRLSIGASVKLLLPLASIRLLPIDD